MAAPTIKVWPKDESVRSRIKHPFGMAFRETLNDGVDWPDDHFTKRRIRDGSVLTEAPQAQQQQSQERNPRRESKSE